MSTLPKEDRAEGHIIFLNGQIRLKSKYRQQYLQVQQALIKKQPNWRATGFFSQHKPASSPQALKIGDDYHNQQHWQANPTNGPASVSI